jgi:hypothetical protein
VLSYINKRLDIYAEIIGNLNVISVLVEKSKIYGCDILSMVNLYWDVDGKGKSV